MKLMITGGGGFVGARLANTLLKRGSLAGQRIERLVLADIAAPPAGLGLYPHENFADIIRQYIDDCPALPNANQTLSALT